MKFILILTVLFLPIFNCADENNYGERIQNRPTSSPASSSAVNYGNSHSQVRFNRGPLSINNQIIHAAPNNYRPIQQPKINLQQIPQLQLQTTPTPTDAFIQTEPEFFEKHNLEISVQSQGQELLQDDQKDLLEKANAEDIYYKYRNDLHGLNIYLNNLYQQQQQQQQNQISLPQSQPQPKRQQQQQPIQRQQQPQYTPIYQTNQEERIPTGEEIYLNFIPLQPSPEAPEKYERREEALQIDPRYFYNPQRQQHQLQQRQLPQQPLALRLVASTSNNNQQEVPLPSDVSSIFAGFDPQQQIYLQQQSQQQPIPAPPPQPKQELKRSKNYQIYYINKNEPQAQQQQNQQQNQNLSPVPINLNPVPLHFQQRDESEDSEFSPDFFKKFKKVSLEEAFLPLNFGQNLNQPPVIQRLPNIQRQIPQQQQQQQQQPRNGSPQEAQLIYQFHLTPESSESSEGEEQLQQQDNYSTQQQQQLFAEQFLRQLAVKLENSPPQQQQQQQQPVFNSRLSRPKTESYHYTNRQPVSQSQQKEAPARTPPLPIRLGPLPKQQNSLNALPTQYHQQTKPTAPLRSSSAEDNSSRFDKN